MVSSPLYPYRILLTHFVPYLHVVCTAPLYVAPEVFSSKETSIDGKAADVFSLAIILWEMWTCEVPYGTSAASCSWQVLDHVVKGGRPSLEGPRPFYPRLRKLLQKCWAAKPSQRPSITHVERIIVDTAFLDPFEPPPELEENATETKPKQYPPSDAISFFTSVDGPSLRSLNDADRNADRKTPQQVVLSIPFTSFTSIHYSCVSINVAM